MKKLILATAAILLFAGQVTYAHKTCYGAATRTGKKVVCNDATATCFTAYDDGSMDIFFAGGTEHYPPLVVETHDSNTGETVPYEALPPVMIAGDYYLVTP